MVMLMMKIRKKSCLASFFPTVLTPNLLATDPEPLRLGQVHQGCPLGGLNPQAPSAKHFASAQRSLLAVSWPWEVGGPPDRGPRGAEHLPYRVE